MNGIAATVIAVIFTAALVFYFSRVLFRSKVDAEQQLQAADFQLRESTLNHEIATLDEQCRRLSEHEAELAAEVQTLEEKLLKNQHDLIEAQTRCRQLDSMQNEIEHLRGENRNHQNELQILGNRLAASEAVCKQLQERENEHLNLQAAYQTLQERLTELQVHNERLATQVAQERQAHEEKQSLLLEARDTLGSQFKQLANEILEEKGKRFSEHSREQLGQMLTPLNERIGQFSMLVQNTYEKESKERLTLENELKRLQQLNHQLHGDAKALTDALTGTKNKTQGNWGEMILESVLAHSGLQKDREYIIQAATTRTEEDGSTRRLQPDVLVNLPDGKQIVIDAKVSLTAYTRYTRAENSDDAAAEAAAHLASIRSHIKGLSAKDYSRLDGVRTLDFIFMFVPVEPAYLLAVQHDPTLVQECFERRIMIVGPSTLLATLRTVAHLWRNEQQNQNALKIAEEGGKLYDKFVLFVKTLDTLGDKLRQTQQQFDNAYSHLKTGRGNLINRAAKLEELGVKTTKKLDKAQAYDASALHDGETEHEQ